jgi:hypothetical protein
MEVCVFSPFSQRHWAQQPEGLGHPALASADPEQRGVRVCNGAGGYWPPFLLAKMWFGAYHYNVVTLFPRHSEGIFVICQQEKNKTNPSNQTVTCYICSLVCQVSDVRETRCIYDWAFQWVRVICTPSWGQLKICTQHFLCLDATGQWCQMSGTGSHGVSHNVLLSASMLPHRGTARAVPAPYQLVLAPAKLKDKNNFKIL